MYSLGCLFIGKESSCSKFVLKYMPRKGPLSFILQSLNRRGYYISKRKECVLVFSSVNSLFMACAFEHVGSETKRLYMTSRSSRSGYGFENNFHSKQTVL